MSQSTSASLLRLMQREFDEMPGLSLTERQAARLWQLPPDQAAHLLHTLVDARVLVRDRDRYARPSAV